MKEKIIKIIITVLAAIFSAYMACAAEESYEVNHPYLIERIDYGRELHEIVPNDTIVQKKVSVDKTSNKDVESVCTFDNALYFILVFLETVLFCAIIACYLFLIFLCFGITAMVVATIVKKA